MSKWSTRDEMGEEVGKQLTQCLRFSHLTIDTEIQKQKVEELKELVNKVLEFKRNAQKERNEDDANFAFALQHHTIGFFTLLEMWILLKSEDYSSAWESLMAAQHNLMIGLKAARNDSIENLCRNLHALETLLFPPQLFSSSGYQYLSSECSICGGPYGECGHIRGKMYMGELCHNIIHEFHRLDHVAIVEHPEDKRLRLPEILDGKVKRCSLTLRIVGDNDSVIRNVPLLRN